MLYGERLRGGSGFGAAWVGSRSSAWGVDGACAGVSGGVGAVARAVILWRGSGTAVAASPDVARAGCDAGRSVGACGPIAVPSGVVASVDGSGNASGSISGRMSTCVSRQIGFEQERSTCRRTRRFMNGLAMNSSNGVGGDAMTWGYVGPAVDWLPSAVA